jgi:hypothetical protein
LSLPLRAAYRALFRGAFLPKEPAGIETIASLQRDNARLNIGDKWQMKIEPANQKGSL